MRRGHLLVAAILGVLSMAPTVGDVGGCGREATDLDQVAFVDTRKVTDCKRCRACDITTARCTRACDNAAPPETVLPATCRPLTHDGEACIRALNAASCSDYASYMDDVSPSVPSECDFCRVPPPAATPGPTLGDGGTP